MILHFLVMWALEIEFHLEGHCKDFSAGMFDISKEKYIIIVVNVIVTTYLQNPFNKGIYQFLCDREEICSFLFRQNVLTFRLSIYIF